MMKLIVGVNGATETNVFLRASMRESTLTLGVNKPLIFTGILKKTGVVTFYEE